MTAWPPLYSQPTHASAEGAKPLLAAVSVVTSMASSLAGPVLIQQWSSDTCYTGRIASARTHKVAYIHPMIPLLWRLVFRTPCENLKCFASAVN